MPWYRTPDGQGVMHLCIRGRGGSPQACQAEALPGDKQLGTKCGRMSVALCDGRHCDIPICEHHRVVGGKNVDYCPRHQHLAPAALPLESE
jgi:hypothetical protein